jgi:hypothetical protein
MLRYITENYGIKRHFQQYLSYIVVGMRVYHTLNNEIYVKFDIRFCPKKTMPWL